MLYLVFFRRATIKSVVHFTSSVWQKYLTTEKYSKNISSYMLNFIFSVQCTKGFEWIIWLNPHLTYEFLEIQWENWNTKRLSNLPKVTQQARGVAQTWTQMVSLQGSCS